MITWLYQMTEANWPRTEFLRDVYEGSRLVWGHGAIKSERRPETGDVVMLFYAPTGSEVPGICGKGAIERYSPRNETITFSVTLPTDFLRERPWWNSKAKIAVNDIRGFPPRGTLFYVNRRQAAMLREGLSEWLRIADQ